MINRNDIDSHKVFFKISSFLFTFFNIDTRFIQNTILKIGVKYIAMYWNNVYIFPLLTH